ncbi:hypothetical protein QFZ56_007966, partial [Streptomyces achromogenes]|nr:hypothetical protein [Streptomyces achromogenes]
MYWPMLCLSIGLLVWRVIDGDSAVRIVVAAGLVVDLPHSRQPG